MPLLSLAVVLFLAIPPFVLSQISLANIVEDDNLFPFETAQITDATIASLSVDDVPYFGWAVNQSSSSSPCKNFPGNASWPSDAIWARFNAFTGDAVIKTVPIGAPCYPGTYQNAEKCAYISVNWGNSTLQQVMGDPTSMMSPFWQGRTCEPPIIYANPSGYCTMGGYPSYAVNVSNVAQIQLAVNFARNNDIRLVVKNTGHDFSGKSGGAGALSIWTHHLKDIEFIPSYMVDGDSYTGPAFKAGSGVQAWEIYEAANEKGMVVVGGEGKTVGVMGGYIQGGGHSPLSSIKGIAADHVLSYSVVLPSGNFVTTSSTLNQDLFFALRGGGGNTFGIVTSVTVKAYPGFPVTGTRFTFGVTDTVSYDSFWAGVRAYFNYFIPLTDAGTYGYFHVFPGPAPSFLMAPFFAPNLTISETQALLNPWLTDLAILGIIVTPEFYYYPNYLAGWEASFPQETIGEDDGITGSRLFPRCNWLNESLLNATFDAWKSSTDQGSFTINFMFAPRYTGPGEDDTAVNPAFRQALMHAIQGASWVENGTRTDILAGRNNLTARQQVWRDVSPGAGAYLGESDREEVDFEQSFYGYHYPALLEVKRKYDPWELLWVKTGVGSEGWAVVTSDPINDENGPLCRVSA